VARALLRHGRPLGALALAPDDPLVLQRLGCLLAASKAEDYGRPRAAIAKAAALAALGNISAADDLAAPILARASATDRLVFELARARWRSLESIDRLDPLSPTASAAAALSVGPKPTDVAYAEGRLAAPGAGAADIAALSAAISVCSADGRRQRAALNAMFVAGGLTPVVPLDEPVLTFAALAPEGQHLPRFTDCGQTPVVSVLMPAFNVEAYVATAIRSIRAQTMSNLELIVVDDASRDGTYAAMERAADGDARVKLIRHDANRGTYKARNTALGNATGRYVTVLDADDWAHPERLARHLAVLQKRNAIATLSNLVRMDDRGAPVSPMIYPLIRQNTSSLMLPRSTLEALGGFPELLFGGDEALLWRVKAAFGRVRRLPLLATVASHRAASMTTAPETGTSTLEAFACRVRQREALLLSLSRLWR
jgi:hypothetical protein